MKASRGRSRSSDLSRQRGAVLVEMALVAPILVLLALGIVDLGRVLFTKIPVQQATQEGSIYAGHFPTDPAAIRAQVKENTDSITLTDAEIGIYCPVTSPDQDDIEVRVQTEVDLITPLLSNMFGGSITLTSSQTAEILGTDSCTASPLP